MRYKVFLACFGVALLVAAPVHGSVLSAQNNGIHFLNWEGLGLGPVGVDLATPLPGGDGSTGIGTPKAGAFGQIDVGDTLDGVFQSQNISNGLGPVTQSLLGGLDPSLTAHFSIMVTAKRDVSGGLGLAYEFDFGPNPLFAPFYALPPGTMLAIYEDLVTVPTAQDFTMMGLTHAANVATVTDGTLLMALGMTAPAGVAEYWVSEAGTDIAALPVGGSAEFFYGLSLLGGSLPPALVTTQVNPFLTPVANPVTAPYAPGGILPGGFLNDFVGEGDVSPILVGPFPPVYPVFSDDPALINVIPEPSSIMVWSLLGLVGCLVSRYRLRRRRA